MIKIKGIIVRQSEKHKNYIFMETGTEKKIVIPYDSEYSYLIKGDLVHIYVDENKTFLAFIDKFENIYLESLKKYCGTENSIEAYVYEQNSGGYKVSYNGFQCFLPNSLSGLEKAATNPDELLEKMLSFHVLSITETAVILSRESYLKKQKSLAAKKEIENFYVGQRILGEIIAIQNFGIFISRGNTIGLLPIDEIFQFLHGSTLIFKLRPIFIELISTFLKPTDCLSLEIVELIDDKVKYTLDSSAVSNHLVLEKIFDATDKLQTFYNLRQHYYPKPKYTEAEYLDIKSKQKILKGEISDKNEQIYSFCFIENDKKIEINIPYASEYCYLTVGDIIEIVVDQNNEYLVFLKRISNIHLETLKYSVNTENEIEGYVYEHNKGGYLVEYNGFNCFLPASRSGAEKHLTPATDLLYNTLRFHVLSADNGDITLCRYTLSLKQRQMEINAKIAKFSVGQKYISQIASLNKTSIKIKIETITCILSFENLLYFIPPKKLTKKVKSRFLTLLSDIFKPKDFINVEIIEKLGNKVLLGLNLSENNSTELMKKIMKAIDETKSLSMFSKYYYSKTERLKTHNKSVKICAVKGVIKTLEEEIGYLFVENNKTSEIKIPFHTDYDFVVGDSIEILIDENNHFFKFIDKAENVQLLTLKKKFKKGKLNINAFVYAHTEEGYLVSYNGYKCLLPKNKSELVGEPIPSKKILNKTLPFKIYSIENHKVILSRLEYLKTQNKGKIKKKEKIAIVGQEFEGELIAAKDNGLYVKFENISGFLHVRDIFFFITEIDLINEITIAFQKLLQDNIISNDLIKVKVKKVSDGNIFLSCDISNSYNLYLLNDILRVSNSIPKLSFIHHYYYPKVEMYQSIPIGFQFKGFIERISPEGLFIRKNNLSGLVPIYSLSLKNTINENQNKKNKYLLENFKVYDYLNFEVYKNDDPKFVLLKIITQKKP